MSEGTDAPVEGLAAFVLQCAKCKTIVGDSWSYVASNKAWSTITLSGASNVDMIDSSAQTSKRTTDFGSTFKLFRCRSCQELLGRIYKTTSRELDELRDHFTFMMDKVSAYSFGSVEVRGESEIDQSPHAPLLLTHEALLGRVQPMEAEILRLKSLCLVFAERLAQLEGNHVAESGDQLKEGTKEEANREFNKELNSANKSSPSNKSHMQHSPSLSNHKSGSALKRRLSEEQPHETSDNNNSNDSRAHKKKRT